MSARLPFALAVLAALAVSVAACTSATPGHGTLRSSTPAAPTSSPATVPASSPATVPNSSPAPSASPPTRNGPARWADPALVAQLQHAAARDLAAVNSYDYRRLAQARRAGLAATTGAFRRRYRTTFVTTVEPNAAKVHAVQSAVVRDVGVGAVSSTSARVLAELDLAISSKTGARITHRTDPELVTADLRKAHGTWLLSDLSPGGSAVGAPPGNPALAAAVRAAGQGLVAITTYPRTGFDRHYALALALTTGALRHDLASEERTVRAQVVGHGLSVTARLAGAAPVTVGDSSVRVLVQVSTTRRDAGGRSQSGMQTVVVTVEPHGGQWLLADVSSVG